MTTNIVSLADARSARTLPSRQDPEAAAVLQPWPLSKKGNPWFRARDYLFVALSPKWRGSSWRIWVKSPDGGSRTLPEEFASFGALQRGVVAFLAEGFLAATEARQGEGSRAASAEPTPAPQSRGRKFVLEALSCASATKRADGRTRSHFTLPANGGSW